MKRLSWLLIVTVMTLGLAASLPVYAGTVIFGGPAVDVETGGSARFGVAADLGSGVWTFNHLNVTFGDTARSSYTNLESDMALLFAVIPDRLWIGPIAGPGVQFEGGEDPLTRLTGAGGVVIALAMKGSFYNVTTWGLTGAWQYAWDFDEGSSFVNGNRFFLGAYAGVDL